MASQLSMDEVAYSALRAIKKSHEEYSIWSDGEWLWNAPEYLLTVNIAKELNIIKKNKYITLEDNVRKTMEIANATGAGRMHRNLRKDGRFDIVLWWAGGTPRAVIEVKNCVYTYKDIKIDVTRIKELLKRKIDLSDFQFGLIAFYISKYYSQSNGKAQLEKQIENIYKSAEEELGDKFTIKMHLQEDGVVSENDDTDTYCAVVFKIRNK